MTKNSGAANDGSTSPASRRLAGKQPSTMTTGYLILYNLVSQTLWMTLTLRLGVCLSTILRSSSSSGAPGGTAVDTVSSIFDEFFPLLSVTQTVALLEIVHALLGLVRASVVTTGMQVVSRIVVVWGVMYVFSKQNFGKDGILGGGEEGGGAGQGQAEGLAQRPGDWAFIGCLAAWGITESVRYAFFVLQLTGKGVPALLLWLRYNTFFLLYPMGISCECALWYLAIAPAASVHPALPWLFKAILVIYIPGSYILFTHMMAQRRKIMRAAKRTD